MTKTALGRPQLNYISGKWDIHTKLEAHETDSSVACCKLDMNDYVKTTSVPLLLQQLDWQPLQERRNVARFIYLFIFFENKIINGIVVVPTATQGER